MTKYNPQKIEKKWQIVWEKSGIHKTKGLSDKPKFYALDMFPYPSGAGLHVGHPKGYIATDVSSRVKMMQGFNILHPMGWDAFGLPAENYAIKNKIHPSIAVKKNIETFKKQLEKFGFNYDWDREINTTDPEFYKWTQWIFLKMFEKGLAYESDEPVNWCPSCKTVLANEDLEKGLCERCGTQVVQKKLRQWVLKITAYADRLLYDLDKEDLDWEDLIIEQQKNWIGRSEGAEVEFRITNHESRIKIYTTRLDTIFGCTYCVVAPEHSLIQELKDKIENYSEVEKYLIKAQNKTIMERTELAKEKTGVELKGVKAINPFTKEEVPVWVADYVLGSYGTGAVMAVPAHDERDFEFAKKYNLPIKHVVAPYVKDNPRSDKKTEKRDVVTAIVKNPKNNTYLCLNWKTTEWKSFPSGGIDGDGWAEAAKREILEETGYKNIKFIKQIGDSIYAEFYRPHKDSNVYANFKYLFFELENEEKAEISEKEKKQHEALWIAEDKVESFVNVWNQKIAWKRYKEGDYAYCEDGVVINSNFYDGLKSQEARDKMTKWLESQGIGSKKVNYKMRDWVFSRQRYWGEPFPLVFCENCAVKIKNQKSKIKIKEEFSLGEILNPGWIAVPDKDLPVKLPEVKSYQPTGTGESPLANIKEWVNVPCPKCGGAGRRETNTMPQWAGSSWYYLRYIDPKNKKALVDKDKEKYWMPVDLYVGGAEHATRHLLYARFWHKFLYDIKVVSTLEPFKRLVHVGLINGEDGRKMSKRWGNVINPDDVIAQFGADTLRLYEMFMGPFTQNIAWSTKGVVGMRRFMDRVWNLQSKIRQENSPEKILVATNNEGKLRELRDHLRNYKILSLKDLKKKIKEPEETGKTFADNSLLKAKYYAEQTGYLTIADDSGLSISALGGKPGVFSSRAAEGDYKKAHERILKEMKGAKDRSAYFQSVVTLYDPASGKYEQFEGKCEGKIANEPKGSGGFGYDPIFMPDELDKSFGECSSEEKYKYDHRKKAVDKLVVYLSGKGQGGGDKELEPLLHKTIKKVTEDIEGFKFNTAISALMVLSNEFDKRKNVPQGLYSKFVILLSPFTPHVAEEIWHKLGHEKSIFFEAWPEYDPELVKEEEVEMIIQINGKLKDRIKAAADISEDEAKKLALENEKIKKALEGKIVKKIIFIKGRLVNIVV